MLKKRLKEIVISSLTRDTFEETLDKISDGRIARKLKAGDISIEAYGGYSSYAPFVLYYSFEGKEVPFAIVENIPGYKSFIKGSEKVHTRFPVRIHNDILRSLHEVKQEKPTFDGDHNMIYLCDVIKKVQKTMLSVYTSTGFKESGTVSGYRHHF